MKQTAVEFILRELANHFEEETQNIYSKNMQLVVNICEKAKEMEKQQIISAGNACALKQTIHNRKVDLMSLEELKDLALKDAINVGEEYYNETFEKIRL